MENKKITISRIMIFAINACLLYLVGKPFVGSIIYTNSEISKEWSYAIAEGITIALVIIMGAIERKNLVSYGICRGTYKNSLKYIIPLGLLALMITPYFFGIPMVDPVVPAVLDVIFIGIMEELIFRGLLFRAAEVLMGEHLAVIISSILFGLIHLVNLSGNNAVSYVLFQVVFNAVIGLGFAALRAKTKSILAGIIIHIILDMNGIFAAEIQWVENAQIIMYFVVGGLLYGFYLAERRNRASA